MAVSADIEHVKRVCDALNRMAGMIHASSCTRLIWSKQAGNPDLAAAAKYGLQLAFTGLAITMRKFEDLYTHHLTGLLPEQSPAMDLANKILADCRQRNLRETTNKLVAHYADEKKEMPLPPEDIEALIRSNGWTYEHEITEWADWVRNGIMEIRSQLAKGVSHGTTG